MNLQGPDSFFKGHGVHITKLLDGRSDWIKFRWCCSEKFGYSITFLDPFSQTRQLHDNSREFSCKLSNKFFFAHQESLKLPLEGLNSCLLDTSHAYVHYPLQLPRFFCCLVDVKLWKNVFSDNGEYYRQCLSIFLPWHSFSFNGFPQSMSPWSHLHLHHP